MSTGVIDLNRVVATREALERVPARLAHKLGVLPLTLADDCLTVVQVDPDDVMAAVQLEGQLGLDIVVARACDPEGVRRALRRYYPEPAEGESTPLAVLDRLVNRALQIHCSDIHLDPEEEEGVVRMRVDGMMRVDSRMGAQELAGLVSAVKVSARLDISEKRVPQDGQLTLESLGEKISMRVATIPTLHGEKVTLRILATAAVAQELERVEALGMYARHQELFLGALEQTHGAVILSGPTGSGKTTTLYAALRHLREPRTLHIVSIEDPVEIPLSGINQVHVDSERVSFAGALRSVMRHDPDVIMIGEIRDGETADIAVKSALTGHLVLSTLHANSSVSVITRLLNLGVPRELVASTLRLVIAQRLVRRPCVHCLEWRGAGDALATEFGIATTQRLPHARGCPLCAGAGYAGRLGLYEMVPVGRTERRLIMEGATEDTLAERAFEELGLRTLLADGRQKALEGLTTPEEVRRVTGLEEGD